MHVNNKNTIARTVRIMFNKQTTPTNKCNISSESSLQSVHRLKTTAQTCIFFSNSDWIIWALSNSAKTRKRYNEKFVLSIHRQERIEYRSFLLVLMTCTAKSDERRVGKTRKYLRFFDVLLVCTLWDFQNRIVIRHCCRVTVRNRLTYVFPYSGKAQGKVIPETFSKPRLGARTNYEDFSPLCRH